MIVCSCNVLSDEQVRTVARIVKRRAASSVYVCLRCRVRCGRCIRTIREIMDKELDQSKCYSASNIDSLGGRSASKILTPYRLGCCAACCRNREDHDILVPSRGRHIVGLSHEVRKCQQRSERLKPCGER